MTVITIANAAGSAGKTTTAVTLSALAASSGRRVLLVDADPQANATTWTDTISTAPDLADVLERRTDTHNAIATSPHHKDLHVLRADPGRMEGIEARLAANVGAEQRLRSAIDNIRDQYDLIVVDCPGSVGILTVSAMVAAHQVLTVTLATTKEMAGLPRTAALMADVKAAYNPTLAFAGIVPCMVPARSAGRLYLDAMAALQSTWNGDVTPAIRRSVRVPESYAARTPLSTWAATDPVTADYRAVADHLKLTN